MEAGEIAQRMAAVSRAHPQLCFYLTFVHQFVGGQHFFTMTSKQWVYPWLGLPVAVPGKQRQQRKRGLRKCENRPLLPSILLAHVQLLDKLNELRMAFQQDTKNCNVMVFTETWLDLLIPDWLSIYHQDRTIESVKSKGGGACFIVNNHWCSDLEIISTGCFPVFLFFHCGF